MNLPESYQKATRIMTLSSQQRMITEETIERVAREVLRWPERRKWNSRDVVRRFKPCFGASGTIVVADHLLWALICLKVYSTVEIHCSTTGWPFAKTFSKWAWYFIERIADLKDDVICLGNRFDGLNGIATTKCFISVDGTDCPAYEPWPFSQQIASDATIFKEGLSTLLHNDEGVEVDRGYKGDDKMKLPDMGMTSKQRRKMKANARAQHETVNGRLKIFNALTTHFRHMKPNRQGMMQKHGMGFNAVAVITQLKFASGETTLDDGLEYDNKKLPAPRGWLFVKRQGGGCFEPYDELDPS
eukprot:jgi/Psemu1/21310/gm1.21310_g